MILMPTAANNEIPIYNPSSIVHLFNKALVTEATKRILHVKGKYVAGRGNNYNGY
jgi:exodeoxyribonuclease VII large subunit